MKKMTKKAIKENLKKEYIEALSFFAEYISAFEEDEQEQAVEDLDTIAWEVAEKADLTEEWLGIYSALLTAI